MGILPLPSRIMKRLPTGHGGADSEVHLAHCLISLLRVRTDKNFIKNKVYLRLMRRLVHIVAQQIEVGVETHLLSECPAPTLLEKYHPFLKASRMSGNKSLALSMIGKFQARGSGFISGKDELSLKRLGVLNKSSFSNRTSTEYCARMLCKTLDFMTSFVRNNENANNRNINICFDAARVSSEHVTWPLVINNVMYPHLHSLYKMGGLNHPNQGSFGSHLPLCIGTMYITSLQFADPFL